MFKITKDDLAKKTNAQLAALFQEVSLGLSVASSIIASAQSALALIRTELAARAPSLRLWPWADSSGQI